jgi:hypothetical protein
MRKPNIEHVQQMKCGSTLNAIIVGQCMYGDSGKFKLEILLILSWLDRWCERLGPNVTLRQQSIYFTPTRSPPPPDPPFPSSSRGPYQIMMTNY